MVAQSVGLVLGSEIAPDEIRPMALEAETAGFGEIWLSEDCFFSGGISGAAIALGATERIPVGIGVVSAVTRHPAVLAMELATLDRAFPGRLMPAVGLGVPAWLGQMGLKPASGLGAVRDCVTMLGTLLEGGTIQSNATFHAEDVRLVHAPKGSLPVQMGVAGPKMLQLSGEVSGGTLLSVLASVEYVRWARAQIDEGRNRAGRSQVPHRITTFALCAVDEDGPRAKAAAKKAVAFYLAAGGPNAITDAYGISDELRALLAVGGPEHVEREMPGQWVEDLAVAGTAGECTAKVRALLDAGCDAVALFPTPAMNAPATVAALAAHVLPHFADPDENKEWAR
ncbi:MAG: 5,10-methylenetetrahydromethanopterin reductase [Nocardioides sp.]|jgi:5,10-methylenetetrahydromethanopterin reductase|nr:5,10-methylenetetrahydromethanopterin reductase [Nocardioides sp.]